MRNEAKPCRCSSDAASSADEYCAAATHNGAAVFLEVKLIHAKMACSSETEGYVSWRLSDKLMEGRVSLAAFGFGDEKPTVLLSDNDGNLRIGAGEGAAGRLRHALRRWWILTQSVRGRAIQLGYLPDSENYVDWGTKWTSHDKEEASIAFLTGSRSRAAHMPPAAAPAHACLSFARACSNGRRQSARVAAHAEAAAMRSGRRPHRAQARCCGDGRRRAVRSTQRPEAGRRARARAQGGGRAA